jgi:hypothetical protein
MKEGEKEEGREGGRKPVMYGAGPFSSFPLPHGSPTRTQEVHAGLVGFVSERGIEKELNDQDVGQ